MDNVQVHEASFGQATIPCPHSLWCARCRQQLEGGAVDSWMQATPSLTPKH